MIDIARHIEEEKHDYEMYQEMANKLEEHGEAEAAGIIRDIANEEKTHSYYLEHLANMLKGE